MKPFKASSVIEIHTLGEQHMKLINLIDRAMINRAFKNILWAAVIAMSFAGFVVTAQENLYDHGHTQLNNQDYQAASDSFAGVVREADGKQDAALYWLAYAQFKGKHDRDALKTLMNLIRNHPNSSWLDDAEALKVEIQDKSGQAGDIDKDEMKLYALNSLMNAPSGRSIDILRKVLNGNNSDQIKGRALFVLSQLDQAEAFELIAGFAKDDSNQNLQERAINMLGVSGTDAAMKLLKEIYKGSSSESAKSMVLNSYMIAEYSDELLELAKIEDNPNLKQQAIHMIGLISNSDALLEMYRDTSFEMFRHELLEGMAMGGGVEELMSVIGFEQDEQLKLAAVQKLGLQSIEETKEYLKSIYQQNTSFSIRSAVIEAMFVQSNATGLMDIVKKEKDFKLKRDALEKLSMMGSDETLEFFNNILED